VNNASCLTYMPTTFAQAPRQSCSFPKSRTPAHHSHPRFAGGSQPILHICMMATTGHTALPNQCSSNFSSEVCTVLEVVHLRCQQTEWSSNALRRHAICTHTSTHPLKVRSTPVWHLLYRMHQQNSPCLCNQRASAAYADAVSHTTHSAPQIVGGGAG
jgi:hypothetical protein